jgi:hypothetical protein
MTDKTKIETGEGCTVEVHHVVESSQPSVRTRCDGLWRLAWEQPVKMPPGVYTADCRGSEGGVFVAYTFDAEKVTCAACRAKEAPNG